MAKASKVGEGFQRPPGFDIGGDAPSPHHPSRVLPITTRGQEEASEFQPPRGQIAGDDLPMGSSTQGMTDNALGDASRSDVTAGCIALGDNPSVESLNPSLVSEDPPLKPGFAGRANGWER